LNKPKKAKNMYFDNPLVESLLRDYVSNGCVDIIKRDEIMTHAVELIRQVIRTHGLNIAYGGGDDASFNDLVQIAWMQIEKTLYKFDYSQTFKIAYHAKNRIYHYGLRGCVKEEDNEFLILRITKDYNMTIKDGRKLVYDIDDLVELDKSTIAHRRYVNTKVFNMWSQVAKTSVLAHIKKETRDKKNFPSFSSYLRYKPIAGLPQLDRFLNEAEDLCKYDSDELAIIEAIKEIANNDIDGASNGLISKIIDKTLLSRQKVLTFFKKIRSCASEFSDSPENNEIYCIGNSGGSTRKYNMDSDEDW